jgi:alkylation response protein AidB-like acyl-CoA dehydrogenase
VAEFVFTAEQNDLRKAVREFLAKACDEAAVRRAMDAGYDRGLWARLGGELGVLGLAVPEDLGGAGGTVVDQAIVAEECGAALLPGPMLGTVGLAVPALAALGEDVSAFVEGRRTAALVEGPVQVVGEAVTGEVDGGADALVTAAQAEGATAYAVTGEVAQVVDGEADVLVVVAQAEGAVALLLVEGGTRTVLSTLDPTRRQARVRFDATPARLLATGADAERALAAARRTAGALLAAEQVGGAQRLLTMTVAHAGTRLQFGRPIGSFQAVKHRCADMLVRVEHARSAAYHAAWALAECSDDPDLAVAVAQAVCSDAYREVALDAVQMHGGIGFTWEHPTHLYVKRAVTDAVLLGSAEWHRERIAQLVLDSASPRRGGVTVAAG